MKHISLIVTIRTVSGKTFTAITVCENARTGLELQDIIAVRSLEKQNSTNAPMDPDNHCVFFYLVDLFDQPVWLGDAVQKSDGL